MKIKNVYDMIGGDYNEALYRLMNDGIIEKFLHKFVAGNYIVPITDAVKEKDNTKLFEACHALKGVALNMSFVKLSRSASNLTDYVRGENAKTADRHTIDSLYNKLLADYNDVINAISTL